MIDAHTSELITQAAFTWRDRADSHVKQLIKRVRGQHYWEAVGFACLAATLLMASSFMLGWVSRGHTNNGSLLGLVIIVDVFTIFLTGRKSWASRHIAGIFCLLLAQPIPSAKHQNC